MRKAAGTRPGFIREREAQAFFLVINAVSAARAKLKTDATQLARELAGRVLGREVH